MIREQADALGELSTPVLQVRERLLILLIARTMSPTKLTDQLLRAIRKHRARVVVIDITGVADVDEPVANHLVQTVDASRLRRRSHHHRAVLGDRTDAGHHRCRPRQDEHGRRPAGRHRGG